MEDSEVQLHEEEGGEEDEEQKEKEEMDDLHHFNTLLSVLLDLSIIIHDYDAAISQIESYGDTIDDICALVERLQWHKEFVTEGGLGCLLQMLSSVCDEVVNLALAGLERILSRWEVAEHAAKAGAFDLLVDIVIKNRESESYATSKASDVLAFLLAPSPNRYLKEQALNHAVFDVHTDMLFSGNENLEERGLQFLWCITNSYPEAQRKICRLPKVVEKILQAITDSDAGKNALRVLHNIAIHESALVTLPILEIEKILASILKIPNPYIASGDKEIAALILAALSPGISVETVGGLVLNQLEATLYDYLHDELRHYDLPDIIQAINHITTALLLKDLDKVVEDSNVAGDLIFLLAAGSSIATSDEKALASQVALALVKRRLSLKTFQNEDTLEILEILEDSDDERLVRNCYSILRFLREAEQDHDHKLRRTEGHDSPKPQLRIASPRLPELRARSPSSPSLPSPVTSPNSPPLSPRLSETRTRSSSSSSLLSHGPSSNSPPLPRGSSPLSLSLSDTRARSSSASSFLPPGPSTNSPPLPRGSPPLSRGSPAVSPRPELRPRSPSSSSLLLSPGSSFPSPPFPPPPGSSPSISSSLSPRSPLLFRSLSPSLPRRFSTDLPEEEAEEKKQKKDQEEQNEDKEEQKENKEEKNEVGEEDKKNIAKIIAEEQSVEIGTEKEIQQDKDKHIPEKPHIPHEPHEIKTTSERSETNETSETRESRRAPIDEAKIEIFRERALPTLDPHFPHPRDPPQIALSPLASAPLYSHSPYPPHPLHDSSQPLHSSHDHPLPSRDSSHSSHEPSYPPHEPSHSSHDPSHPSHDSPHSFHDPPHDSPQIILSHSSPRAFTPFPTPSRPTDPNGHEPKLDPGQTTNGVHTPHRVTPNPNTSPKQEIDSHKQEASHQTTNHIFKNQTDEKRNKYEDLGAWSCEDVCAWIAELGLSQYKDTFATQRISGRSLRELVRRVDDLQFLQFLGSSLQLTIGDLFTLADGLRDLQH